MRLNVSKNAKYPNLNDLYWNPGGNEDLKVERSHAIEIGLANSALAISENITLETNANLFYLNIEDYILWEPSAFGYWRSRNIEEVESKGVELNLGLVSKIGSVENRTVAQYGYTSSVNKKVKQVNDASVNKQLIYVPTHSFNLRSSFEWKKWSIMYQLNYNAERYTTTDNSDYLPFYTLHNIQLQKQLLIKKQRFVVMAEVNNLLDNSYQAIQWRPMPGRNYGITINYQFVK
jgi:iron complex outermembrane receptor protein